jgi:eukaryotic-like serine/threonine-protein kinase
MREQPTEAFGPYLIYEKLGAGGMATVHRAKKQGIEGIERPVALKRLLPELAVNDEFVRAFVREARLAAQLRHQNICQTYDLGRVEGTYYIAMELVGGADLRQILRHTAYSTGPMPVPLILNVLLQLTEALDYAHTFRDEGGTPLGLVHRDVSPANVIVGEDGCVKLLDFGIAKATAANWQTMSGQLKGKFAYMAPEMLEGQVDARADLFSLGIVAYELLTAQPLFGAGSDDIETLKRVKVWTPPAPSTINRHCPKEVDLVVLTALAKNPTQRWQTAHQLRGAIEGLTKLPGMNASRTDLAAWIQWAFSQPAGARRWDEPSAVRPPSSGDSSVVIERVHAPNVAATLVPPDMPPRPRPNSSAPPPVGAPGVPFTQTLPLPGAQLPPAPPNSAAAARTLFVDPPPSSPPQPAPTSAASQARTLFVDPGPGAQPPGTGTLPWPQRPEPRATPASPYGGNPDAAGRPTMVPGFGPMAAQGTPQGMPLSAMPQGGQPLAGGQLADPGYLQAMAAYNAGGAPVLTPSGRDQARAVVGLPAAPKSSGVGVLLLILLCVVAATGGYFVVHYLTNR